MNYIMQKVLKTVTSKYLRFINLCVLNNSFILKVIDFCSIFYQNDNEVFIKHSVKS